MAIVEAPREFINVLLQVFLADCNVRRADATLQVRPEAFDGVGMNVAAHVLVHLVVDEGVLVAKVRKVASATDGERIAVRRQLLGDAIHVIRCLVDQCDECNAIAKRYAPDGVYSTLEWVTSESSTLREPVETRVSEIGEPDAYLVEYRETLINGSKKRCTQASLEPREPTIFRNEEPEVEARELLKVTPLYASRSATAESEPLPQKDANGKRPRLFYWEDAEDCWCPAEGLLVNDIIGVDLFSRSGDVEEIRFKREDMTDEEHDAIPEG